MVNYSDEMVSELKSFSLLDYTGAQEFADKHNIPLRSVIAKARALGVAYQPKAGGSTVERKADVVAEIEEILGAQFKGLDRLVMDDLKLLLNKVA